MRTETRKYEVYKVDELSDKAKENAYWKWLKGFEYDASDNRATLKAFEEIFKVKVRDRKSTRLNSSHPSSSRMPSSA